MYSLHIKDGIHIIYCKYFPSLVFAIGFLPVSWHTKALDPSADTPSSTPAPAPTPMSQCWETSAPPIQLLKPEI